MKHIALRMIDLRTEYLHRISDDLFAWRAEPHGRHEFDDYDQAKQAATAHGGGLAVPTRIEQPDPHKPHRPNKEKPTFTEPLDWHTKWEQEHDQ